ncbi:MAG: hypothetical protein MRY83_24075 [Flavobacteriales bacterium]|nr:hypothetical protein [Flavobacteriales bacterium]
MRKAISKLPDQILLSIPILEKGRNCSHQEYRDLLEFYARHKGPYEDLSNDPVTPLEISSESNGNVKSTLYSFFSNYDTLHPKMQNEYDAHFQNAHVYLNTWIQNPRKPMVLCIHGLKMGSIKTSYKMFKIESLLKKGLNVALMIQPHHGLRSRSNFKQFFLNPGNIPFSIEAARQAVFDGIKTLSALRSLGFEKIGIVGASLGGFTALNIATQTKIPEFIFASQPAIDFTNHLSLSKANMPFKTTSHDQELIDRAVNLVSPLQHEPRVSKDAIHVLYHTEDLITPPRKIEQLIQNWKIEHTTKVPGGHWLYFDKSKKRGKAWYSWLSKFEYI